MRTANEMYQYCLNNNFGQGQNQKWGLKHFTLIEQELKPNEEVMMCFIGLHNYVSMTKHDSNFAYAVTNRRIIMAQQKVIGKIVQSVALDGLNDITFSVGMLIGIVTIDTIKETFNVAVDKFSAENIGKKIQDLLFSLKQNSVTQQYNPVLSSADEIMKFKNLLDNGIITQEEFEQKKKQLLGL